ncbi:PilX N-terminal domain-containing pilus assembly protein [Thalassotalea sp. PS06]|uniref:PilX N-terminal domain-containing pilus assembly protein n=1 Tax=Thalassotalea sp. PS06 TaxID=2594005 RepID=UPI00163D8F8D|nr:PilX N-terminal domain-containing pilus assembly protein [Thalassotalea sp. PS06]
MKNQAGMAVLAVSVVLVILVTLVSLFLSRTILFEQKMVNNDFKSKSTFESAEAGLAIALEYLANGIDRNNDGVIDFVFDSNGDGIGDSATGVVGQANVVVTVSEVNAGDITSLAVVSEATSLDDASVKVVTTTMQSLDPLPNHPDNPLTTRGNLDVNGSATVHNPEGHSTIWSGGDVDIGSNNSTATYIADPTDSGYPGCMDIPRACSEIQTSNKETVGLDILEHDSDLYNLTPAGIFENFFGMSPEAYKELMASMVVDPSNPSESVGCSANSYDACVAGSTNEVIWFEGDVEINGGTVGCRSSVNGSNVCANADEAPTILIIDGNATFKGSPHFYGVVFIMGDASASGNSTFHGAVITGGSLNSTSGSLDIHFNTGLLKKTRENGPRTVASGSWRDF